MFNFIIVYKLDPPVPKGDLYTEKALSLQLIDKRSEIYFKKVKRDE